MRHVRTYLESFNYFRGMLEGLFILVGGNDLSKRDADPAGVARQLEDLITEVTTRNPGCLIVTGSIVPRAVAGTVGEEFMSDCETVDREISKWSVNHHHFVHDAFVGELVRRRGSEVEVGIRREAYERDRVHLNEMGKGIFRSILDYVIESCNRQDFTSKGEVGEKEDRRLVLWKF